jgi:acyl-CoA thioesterase
VKFSEMMTLDERGPDSYMGRGPSYPWGGLYGGQIVAQSLVAAAATVEPRFRFTPTSSVEGTLRSRSGSTSTGCATGATS